MLVCRLNRPAARNGLIGALLGEYLTLLEDARKDDAVRVVMTTGEGDVFSADADVRDLSGETAGQGLNALLHDRLRLTGTRSAADRAFDRLAIGRETLTLKNYDKPLIAGERCLGRWWVRVGGRASPLSVSADRLASAAVKR